jgi:predicted amidophosphoribosyltransferase
VKNYYPNFFQSVIHTNPSQLWRAVLDLFFPRHCLDCGAEKTWLCPDCLDYLPRSYAPIEDKIFSVFDYSSPVVKQVIWRLKYKRSLELAETLAKPMHDLLLEELEDELIVTGPRATGLKSNFEDPRSWTSSPSPQIILIPAPLSPARFRSRGYNQAKVLAQQIARLNPTQFIVRADLVKKVKNTPTQVSIKSREQRLANLKGAFEITASCESEKSFFVQLNATSHLAHQIFVIIDDVSTTGATINEIRQLLAHHFGARHLYGLVVAHG